MKKIALVLFFPVMATAQVTTYVNPYGQVEMYATQTGNNTFYTTPNGQDIASSNTVGQVTTYIGQHGQTLGAAIASPPWVDVPLAPPEPPKPPEPPVFKLN